MTIIGSRSDGLKLCRASSVKSFKHNDTADLERILFEQIARIESERTSETAQGPGIIVIVEAIYSMGERRGR
jgi:7-keto-8-aminopelargonate synthetase-like enzyme